MFRLWNSHRQAFFIITWKIITQYLCSLGIPVLQMVWVHWYYNFFYFYFFGTLEKSLSCSYRVLFWVLFLLDVEVWDLYFVPLFSCFVVVVVLSICCAYLFGWLLQISWIGRCWLRSGHGEGGDELVGGVASGWIFQGILMSVFLGGMLPGGIPGCVVELVSSSVYD
jgi:hypothetical protein